LHPFASLHVPASFRAFAVGRIVAAYISTVGSGEKVLIQQLSKTPSRYCDITLSARQHPRFPELNFGGQSLDIDQTISPFPSAKTGI